MMAALAVTFAAVPARAELLVSISKSQQRLSVSVDGSEAYRWPVSTGRKGFSTPTGAYRPTRLERHWYSRKYEMAPMPWSVFFYKGYAVHGTTEVANLGRAASHGCVRLRPDNASILFSMVKRYGARNTKFVVLDGPLPNAPKSEPMAKLALLDLTDAAEAPAATEHLSAKAYAAEEPAPKAAGQMRVASVEQLSVSIGSESKVLREREAWLRAIDRKYGITH